MNSSNLMKLVLTASFVIAVLVISLLIYELTSTKSIKDIILGEKIVGTVIKTSYTGEDKTTIINSEYDLKKLISQYRIVIDNTYESEYFKKKSLAIIYVDLTSGMYRLKYEGAEISESILKVSYSTIRPSEFVTTDMSGAIIIIEVDKKVDKIEAKEI